MLTVSRSLIFPKLVYLDRTEFPSWKDLGTKKGTDVFKLDWSEKAQRDQLKFAEWRKSHGIDVTSPIQYLPEPYESWSENLKFAIPRKYLDEIRRMSQLGLLEWNLPRSFDTVIREMCLEPAIAFIKCAFKLIADCVYDTEKKYFYRGDDKILVSHCLLYKFWSHQTGRGLVQDHSDCIRLEQSLKWLTDQKHKAVIADFLTAIKKHEDEMEKNYQIYPDAVFNQNSLPFGPDAVANITGDEQKI